MARLTWSANEFDRVSRHLPPRSSSQIRYMSGARQIDNFQKIFTEQIFRDFDRLWAWYILRTRHKVLAVARISAVN